MQAPTVPGPPVLETRGVRKVYRLSRQQSYEALRGVDLSIQRGEMVAIVGPSGSGKSTLMNLLSTLDRPSSGAILVDGVDTSRLGDDEVAELRNRRIGIVFQSYNLIARMTAVENVEVPLIAMGVPRPQRLARAEASLRLVGLGHRLRNRPAELSGGEQQRVSIARALVTKPSILLGDEPTGNLDTANARSVLELLHGINREQGVTTIIITHDPEVAASTQRVIHIRDGRVERDERTAVAA
ncbi:MAG: putative transport system ATP-binding protein [Thermoplasmata archaeon]|jgi:putative ABC transport system ATP-binding protein|nr:putative transport system ATP-binding protein [Thermoplasmata archaeon]